MEKTIYTIYDSKYNDGVSLHISNKGDVMAEYTQEPRVFKNKEDAEIFLEDIKNRAFNYTFSTLKYIREKYIQPENLEIVESIIYVDV